MKRVTRNGVLAVAAASGAMAVAMPVSAALAADGAVAGGSAAGSPGLISGNTVQLPVDVPVNVCGNTVNVVGLLNPAVGNACANTGGAAKAGPGGGPDASGGASAQGGGKDSPGVLAGNTVQLPVHLPVNVSGNTVNGVGIGNPARGNTSVNTSDGPVEPPAPQRTVPSARQHRGPRAARPASAPAVATLAHTGADLTVPAAAGGAALLLTGIVLRRRFRPGRFH
ncbi:chaplin [Streptomyces sp. NPDC006739]|uniref:chaplin n=1 Tax=Streptomyces sp. NPDC006739 TaxID=3364763 RepID=UPI00368A30CC